MTELALDDVQRDALAGELDGVRVTELVRGNTCPLGAKTTPTWRSSKPAQS